MSDSIYDIEVENIRGEKSDLSAGRGKVMLIVNTASKCGFTPHYKGLEALHREYEKQGLMVLGFPCNQFGAQEPGTEEEIADFCDVEYSISFPLHAKIDVNGGDTHALYDKLKADAPGFLGTQRIKWNFTKFLVDRTGRVVERFASATPPEKLQSRVRALLAEPS